MSINYGILIHFQVTQFGCGGFVIGLVFCHSICDGLGAAQFLNAVGELARGLEKPSMEPVWHRDFFPSLQELPQEASLLQETHHQIMPVPEYQLEHANIDIPIVQINRMKREFQQLTGRSCSAFDVVAASFWRSRTRAINDFDPNTQVKLVFFANCRKLLDPPLPNGFYGNCFFPVTVTASCESLREAFIVDVVKLIQEAKAKLPLEFGKYLKGEHLNDPFAPSATYTTLFMSEWGRLGFDHVDYRWGPPVHVVPIQGFRIMPAGIVGSLPLPNRGIRLVTWCVEEAHRLPFLHHMNGVMNQQLL